MAVTRQDVIDARLNLEDFLWEVRDEASSAQTIATKKFIREKGLNPTKLEHRHHNAALEAIKDIQREKTNKAVGEYRSFRATYITGI